MATRKTPRKNDKPGDQAAPREDAALDPAILEERIRKRAYELYQQRGGEHGQHHDDWAQAEHDIRNELSKH